MTSGQQTFYLVETFEREINNGGFDQFFINSSSDHPTQTVTALKTVGRADIAKMLEQATKKFPGGSVPLDPSVRADVMEDLEDVWEDLDEKYYGAGVSLAQALIAFVRANQADF